MFSNSNKQDTSTQGLSQQNTIAHGTTLVGDITSKGEFRIDGVLKGTLKTTGKVVVGKTGAIHGDMEAKNADFEGVFTGKMTLSNTLSIRSSAHIDGEVQTGKLSVEPGAVFNATCTMKTAVKALKNGQQTKLEKGKSA
jgi:cytoskeletal protein CcmA (bactofilin family)